MPGIKWIGLVFLGLTCAAHAGGMPQCGDFLAERRVAIHGLRYQNCQGGKSAQLRTLVARYTVTGKQAKAVEQQLGKIFGMTKLVFHCCGWENNGVAGFYKDAAGFSHSVTMTSGETLAKDWRKIPEFTVTDELFLEEP